MNDEEVKKLKDELEKCFSRVSCVLWELSKLGVKYYGGECPTMGVTRLWLDDENKKIELLPF